MHAYYFYYYYRYEHRPGIKYTVNCWDFAGQEEFYSTHQCFLTPRSIYVVRHAVSGKTRTAFFRTFFF